MGPRGHHRARLVAALICTVAAAVLCTVTGCGTSTRPAGPASYDGYAGPLDVPVPNPPPTDGARAGGAAAKAVACVTRIDGGYSPPTTYREVVSSSPTEQLDRALAYGASPVGTQVRADLHLVRSEGDRQLWVYDKGGVPLYAVIFLHGTAPDHRTGWWIESWAGCNVSEFPPKIAKGLGIQLWRDANGQALPTYEVVSTEGPKHCDWQSATFLDVAGGSHEGGGSYVRDPQGALAGIVDGYQASVPLPADARATGWQRDSKTLWLAADGTAAYVGKVGQSVERWPRLPKDFGCA